MFFGFNPSPFFFGKKKSRLFKPSLQLLAIEAGAVFYMDARKISGGQPGVNSPVTTTITDLSEFGNNVTMYNLAGTATDGYVIANDLHYLKADGVDTYGTIMASESMNISDEDFSFCWGGILTKTGFIFAKCLDDSSANVQYGVRIESDLSVNLYLDGASAFRTSAGVIALNEFVRIEITRIQGHLKIFVNDVMIMMRPDTTVLITNQPYIHLFSRHGDYTFSGGSLAYFAILKGEKLTELGITQFSDEVSKDYITIPAKEYYVSPSGNNANPGTLEQPFATIRYAADFTKSGDTLYLRGGTHIPPDYGLWWGTSGRAGKPIIIRNYPGETPVLDGIDADWGYNWEALFNFNKHHYVTLDGLKVINSMYGGIGDYLDENGSVGITVKNCSVYNTYASGIAFYGECRDIVIDNNSLENVCTGVGTQECLSISNCYDVVVSNNHVFNITSEANREGIDIKNGCRNVKVFGNIVNNIQNHAIYIDAFEKPQYNIEVYNNTVYDAPAGITVATEYTGGNLYDVIVRNNTVYNCTHGLTIADWEEGSIRLMSYITFKDNHITATQWALIIGNPDATYITIKDNYLKSGAGQPSMFIIPEEYVGPIDISTYTIDGNQITGVYAGHPTGTNYTIIS